MKQLIARLRESPLVKDSFWALTGNILSKGLSLIAGIAIARFLGDKTYGEYGMIRNNLTMIAVFSTLGLGYTATKFISESKQRNNTYINNIHKIINNITLFTSTLLMIIVITFASPIAKWLEAYEMASLLRISAIAIVFNAINTTQIGELSGFNAYRNIAKNNTISGIFTFILSVTLTFFYNIKGAVIALVLSLIFNCIINKISLNKFLKKGQIKKGDHTKKTYKKIIKFTLPIALQESTYSITSWASTIVIIKLAGYGELGTYSAAAQWFVVMLFIPSSLRNVALSHLSEANISLTENKRILIKMSIINFLSTLIPAILVCICSPFICSLYGDSYNNLNTVLNLLIFSSVINAVLNAISQNLIALNQNWYLFISRLLKDAISLIIFYILIQYHYHGAISYAIANISCSALYLIIILNKQRLLYRDWKQHKNRQIN